MSGICPQCARRAWLLGKLGAGIDYRAGELSRLWSILELPDTELIGALGGRHREELRNAYIDWKPTGTQAEGDDALGVCPHGASYPKSLRDSPLAPHALYVRGEPQRLSTALEEKVVAIVGTRRASDYGIHTAHDLARGLAASGLTIASGLGEGIPAAVHSAVLEVNGSTTVSVMAGSLERCSPAWCGELYRRLTDSGCAVSEVPPGGRYRRWLQPGRARTLALLADLVIVVEAGDHPWELACAHVAQAHGKPVSAVPGRVSSPASRGTNALLANGAQLVRGPQDALDILYGVGVREPPGSSICSLRLEPRLRAVLERVGDGDDTVAKLAARGSESHDVALALAELEIQGLLRRGDGGRYVPGMNVMQAESNGLSGLVRKVRSTPTVCQQRTDR